MFVQAPVTISCSTPRPLSRMSRRVWKKPFIRIFSTTWSPSLGSRPSTGAAPQVPRTSASASLTPWNSGAFCLRPAAPFSTMYQTWITGTPLARHASASAATLATTPCAVACAGAPESANAPPSMMTSFCRSWITSADRDGSSARASLLTRSPHVREAVARDLAAQAVHRRRRGDEQPAPVGTAPVDVAHGLRHLHGAQVLPLGAEDAHPERARLAPRAGDPDVAALVELHAVDEVADGEVAGPDPVGHDAPGAERAVVADVERADVRPLGVVDVEDALVGGEAEAVGLAEVVIEQLGLAAAGGKPVQALEGEVLLALDAEPRHAPVRRVGEVDRAVALYDDVVGAVELLALEVRRQHLAAGAAAVRVHADDRARDVLADDEAPVEVERHPVALVRRAGDLAHPALLVPPATRVAGHVAEEQIALGVPERTLREREPGAELLELRPLVDQLEDGVGLDLQRHRGPSLSVLRNPPSQCART